MSTTALSASALYRACAPGDLPFETTASLADGHGPFGQARAVEAIRFALDMKQPGHNLFVMGPPGTGRRSFVIDFVERAASSRPAPADWCYVYDFECAEKPRALQLPAGAGPRLAADLRQFVDDVQAAVGAAFSGEKYRAQRQAIEREFQEQQSEAFERVQGAAHERGIRIMQTPGGMVFAPVENGEVLGPEEFNKLSPERQREIQAAVEAVGKLFQESMKDVPERLRASRERIRDLDRQVAAFAIERLVGELARRWHLVDDARAWIEALREDLAKHYELLRPAPPDSEENPFHFALDGDEPGASRAHRRYAVNVFVTRDPHGGAPVVVEERPTYTRLLGKIEQRARFGALMTDFSLVRAGALQQANGGYLVLKAEHVLAEPFAWSALKEALQTRQARIVPLDQLYGLAPTVSLEPVPIPLDVKVVLVGNPRLYYLLSELDPEFDDFFKVMAEFDDRTERSAESALEFARVIARIARADGLPPLAREAVARVIEEASRQVEDSARLSTEIRRSADLVREAGHWCHERHADTIERVDVEQAIERRAYRSGRLRERIHEEILRDTILVATAGERVGQINGLAVLAIGDSIFGRASRITARVSPGSGGIVDIEREAELGGALHSKGVMILAGYINARFATEVPAAFAATLAFEQSYGGIDGDSASSTELYALLSALADVPIRQCYAVTGSVNQFGEIQAIGGVNHKIEGFFDLCAARGLSGEQGVLIPAANVKHLMLRPRVIEAVAASRFHIHAVETVDQGLAILTGHDVGVADADGNFPPDSIHGRVVARFARFAEMRRKFARGAEAESS
ncbi:MAG: Lon protease family protein [Gammaproteobacteria bacterium]